MNSLNLLSYTLLLSVCVLLISCSKQINLTEMIVKKNHDKDGIYHVEYNDPQHPDKINEELTKNGYKIKEAYYWDGLTKKTDKYKFLSFYGPEYYNLKGVRDQERLKDSLLNTRKFKDYQLALKQFPELKKNDNSKTALAHLSSFKDVEHYKSAYTLNSLENTQGIAQKWVKTAADLILYKNLYGINDFVESEILNFLPLTNEIEAKQMSDNFGSSRYLRKIELHYLTKVSEISDFIRSKECTKHFGINGRFDFQDSKEVQKFNEKIFLIIPSELDAENISFKLIDKHLEEKLGRIETSNSLDRIDSVLQYSSQISSWTGEKYWIKKEERMIQEINQSKFPFEMFETFYAETNSIFSSWQWNNGVQYISNANLIETFKGSKRVEKSTESKSNIEQILYEKVDNKVFIEIENSPNLDEFSNIRLAGQYKVKGNDEKRFPFHIVFELNKKDKSYRITELVMSNYGVANSYFDGQKEGSSLFYDKNTAKLTRLGK